MDWNLEVEGILASWSVDPAPLATNPRLLSYILVAQAKLNKIPELSTRIISQVNLQQLLNYVASEAIQRAWYKDPRSIVSESQGIGPFSSSYSKSESSSGGIYFTRDELDLIIDHEKHSTLIPTITMGGINPNFNIYNNRSWRDNEPIGSDHDGGFDGFDRWH